MITLRGPSCVRRGATLQDLGIIPDGSVLIRDGQIEAVGPTRRIENLKETRNALEIPVDDMVVMPGFVDPNVQLNLYPPVDQADRPRRRRNLADFYNEALTFMRSCLQYGTLNLQVKAASGLCELRSDISVLRQLVKLGNSPVGSIRVWRLGLPSRLPQENANALSAFKEVLASIESRLLAHFVEFDVSSEMEADPSLWPPLEDCPLGVHLVWCGGSPSLLQALLTRYRTMDICTPHELSAAEIQILSDADSICVFSLGKELLQEHAGTSVRDLADNGGAIALASGYDANSSPTFSMQMVLALAHHRLGLTAEQAISAATINAAHAIGRGHEIGTLEVGKKADLIVLNVPDYREIFRRLGTNHVGMAIREGVIAFNRTRWKVGTA